MDLVIGVERLAAIAFIITGLSHIAAPRTWARFFIDMRARGEVAGFLNAWVHIPLGLLILAFHPIWSWPRIVVTLLGCALTLKGTIHFMWPKLTLRTLAHTYDKDDRYVARLLPLAFLAPRIVEAAVAGEQPIDLTAQDLVTLDELPPEWSAQATKLGFMPPRPSR